jgi:hypothetical protein
METTIQKSRFRVLIGVLAVAIVAATIWAAAALAGGGSAGSSDSVTNEEPAAVFTQDNGEGSGSEDCPERNDGGEDDADASANL